MIYFKKNMSYLRSKKSMTLKEISSEMGFSTSQWNNYELGISFPKFLDLIKISKYFDITESELIHVDLEINQLIAQNEEKSLDKIILLQNKLINIQEEKINELEMVIKQLKKNR